MATLMVAGVLVAASGIDVLRPTPASATSCYQTWNANDPTFGHQVGSAYLTTGWQASTAGYLVYGGGPFATGCDGRVRAVVGLQIDNNTSDDLEVGHIGVWDMGISSSHGGSSVTYSATTMSDSAPVHRWEVGELVGGTIAVGAQQASITGNTPTTITVSSWPGGTPAAGSTYTITSLAREVAKNRVHRRSFPTTVGSGMVYPYTLNFTARSDHRYGFTIYGEGRATLYARTLSFRQDGDDTKLTSAIGTTLRTTLPVERLTTEVRPGEAVTLTSGTNTQTVTASGAGAAIGATTIPVVAFVPNFNYPAATVVSYLLTPLSSWNVATTPGMPGIGRVHYDSNNVADGWGVDPALGDTAGYMQYGPTDTGRDGTYRVVWQLKIDNNSVDNAVVARLQTWTNNGYVQTGYRDIYRKDFVANNQYQDFAMNFVATPGFGSGYTVYWFGAGRLTVRDVSIWAHDPSWMKWEAENASVFSHAVGGPHGSPATARVGTQGSGVDGNLIYSNPTFTVPGGEGEAMFTLAIGGTGNPDDIVAQIGVYNPGQNLYMGLQNVRRKQFTTSFYQDFHVHFNVNTATPVALYVYWYNAKSTLYVNRVVIHDNVRTDLGHKGLAEFWANQGTVWPRGDRSNNPMGRTYAAESSIVSDGTLYYAYHTSGPDTSLVISSDNGRTFTPYKGGAPVVAKGTGGTWDSSYAILPGVIRGNDETWYMVYEGSDPSTTRIGLATSTDGLTWTKSATNPMLTLNQSWESLGLGSPDINFWYPSTFVVSYTSRRAGTADQLERGIATSTSMTTMSNANKSASNPVLRRGPAGAWDDGGIGPSHGAWSGSHYYWVYDGSDVNEGCGLPNTWRGGMARSLDWVNWDKAASNPIQPTVPGSCAADVHLNTFGGRQYMTWLDHLGSNVDVKNVFE